jgi:hypothetical protein
MSIHVGFPLEAKLRDVRVPPMAKGLTYVVTATGGLRVRALNTFWSEGQYVEIDPAFLAVCDELRQRVKEKLLVAVSPNSEYRKGGPTGVVPSGDEIASLRRGAVARERAPVVVNKIILDRDQAVLDHLSGRAVRSAIAREVAAEASRRPGAGELSDEAVGRIAARVAAMMPAPAASGIDRAAEDRIAASVSAALLPAIRSAAASGPAGQPGPGRGVIEVEVGSALPDTRDSKAGMESHLGDSLATKSVGGSVEDQVADIERILNPKGGSK